MLQHPFIQWVRKGLKSISPSAVEAEWHYLFAIYKSKQSINLLLINKTLSQILHQQHLSLEEESSLLSIIQLLRQKFKIADFKITLVMAVNEYQAQTIESLAVQENELAAALPWKIKNQLTYAIDEAAIDYVILPAKKSGQQHPLLIAFSMHKVLYQDLVTQFYKNFSVPLTITVPEIALKNLASYYESEEKSTVMLFFTSNFLILTISREKQLYFSRHIAMDNTLAEQALAEKLGLDILRCMDYFQNQWRLPTPARLLYLTDYPIKPTLLDMLSQLLHNTIKHYQLESLQLNPPLNDIDYLSIAELIALQEVHHA